MPYKKSPMSKSSCIKMYDKKGKQLGLMMEGSLAYQEETKKVEEAKAKKLDKKQEIKKIKDLLTEMPIPNRAESPIKQIDERSGERDEFGNIIPEGFTSDAPEVTGTRILSDRNIATRTTRHPMRSEELKAKQKAAKKRIASDEYSESERQAFNEQLKQSGYLYKQ